MLCRTQELSPGAGAAGDQGAAGLVGGASRHHADAWVQAQLLPGAQHGHPRPAQSDEHSS